MAKPTATSYLDPTNSLVAGMIVACPFIEGSGSSAMDFADPMRPASVSSWATVGGVPFAMMSAAKKIRYALAELVAFTLATRLLMQAGTNNNVFGENPTDNSYSHLSCSKQNASTHFVIGMGYSSVVSAAGSSVISAASVYDVAVTWDGTSSLKLYVNGALDGSGTGTPNVARNSFLTLLGPDSSTGGGEYLYAWDRELTATEVAAIASNPYSMYLSPSGGGSSPIFIFD